MGLFDKDRFEPNSLRVMNVAKKATLWIERFFMEDGLHEAILDEEAPFRLAEKNVLETCAAPITHKKTIMNRLHGHSSRGRHVSATDHWKRVATTMVHNLEIERMQIVREEVARIIHPKRNALADSLFENFYKRLRQQDHQNFDHDVECSGAQMSADDSGHGGIHKPVAESHIIFDRLQTLELDLRRRISDLEARVAWLKAKDDLSTHEQFMSVAIKKDGGATVIEGKEERFCEKPQSVDAWVVAEARIGVLAVEARLRSLEEDLALHSSARGRCNAEHSEMLAGREDTHYGNLGCNRLGVAGCVWLPCSDGNRCSPRADLLAGTNDMQVAEPAGLCCSFGASSEPSRGVATGPRFRVPSAVKTDIVQSNLEP